MSNFLMFTNSLRTFTFDDDKVLLHHPPKSQEETFLLKNSNPCPGSILRPLSTRQLLCHSCRL